MFDLDNARVRTDSPIERVDLDAPEMDEAPEHPLDAPDKSELHDLLLSYYRQELDRQAENRRQMAQDEDYYDGDQWDEADAALLRDRGQKPLVYNVIAQSINWILGSERRARMDFKVLPRRKEESKAAEAKTSLLKYLADVNRSQFHKSRAFSDAVKVGIGWMEAGIQDEDDGEPIYDRYESWRNVLWDSVATDLDLSDARYLFRSKWVDADIAKAVFQDRADVIDLSVSDAASYGTNDGVDGDDAMDVSEWETGEQGVNAAIVTHQRRRVRLIECWFKRPVIAKRVRSGPFRGEVFDQNDPRHQEVIDTVAERPTMLMHVAVFTHAGLLYLAPTPYRHNRFPLIPIWGYRRGKDNLPYGVIRQLRDIQDDINKRAAKAMHILSTNKVIMDEGAVDDMDEFIEEVARPDAVIVKKTGKSIDLNVDRDLAPAHLDLMSRNIQMIQQVGGVTDELLGRTTNATSGIAIQSRQEQGSVTTNALFDNLRFAEQQRGELELSMIEQFMTEEKQFRILNGRGNADFVTVNDGLPENDITRTKADFVISEQDWQATLRQAAVEQLMAMISKMPPQVGMVMLDLVVENMDIVNRDELVKRIRQISGQKDPDQTEPTQEDMAQMQAAQEQQQFQKEQALTALAEQKAKVAKLQAEADRIKRQTIGDNVTSIKSAMEAATGVVTVPQVAPLADAILAESGWPEAQPIDAPAQPQQPFPQPSPAAAGLPPQGINKEVIPNGV